MDLRGGDPESTRSACVKLRDLAVAAEGPGAPFTATRRGQQLLRLIHIVVQNVGLEDKVGALTALRLLKADDTLLQRLLKEGILPPLLAIVARDAADADGDWDPEPPSAEREIKKKSAAADSPRLVRAETAAAAARAVEAFSSSGDSVTTLLRGGAVEALSNRLCRARGELADEPATRSRTAEETRVASARAATAAACAAALARISGSALASAELDEDSSFGFREIHSGIPPERAAAATSTARSLLCLLDSDAVVAHRAAASGLARLASSGRAGRVAAARCGAVLPLMTAALAGNAAQRAAALAALAAITRGARDGSASARRDAAAEGDVAMSDADGNGADGCAEPDDLLLGGDSEMDDNGGVQSAAAASRAAKEAEAAALEAVNAKANAKAAASRSASGAQVTGTAAKVGETFFARMIDVLAGLTKLRGVMTRAAADASLALWALAWQPSNRRRMSGASVVAPLVELYCDFEGSAAAADDAGAVLGVLARMCERSRKSIEDADPTSGKRLVKHLLDGSASSGGSPGAREMAESGAFASRDARRFFENAENAGEAENAVGEAGTSGDARPSASTSPNIRRTISGQHVAAAIARASPHK